MASARKAAPVSTDIVPEVMAVSDFDKETLATIDSFEDAVRLATETFGSVVTITDTELSDGFRVASNADKDRMVGEPLFLLEWSIREGEFGDYYVSIKALTQNPLQKWILNDGGTGIAADLHEFTRKTGRTGGLHVPQGLRASRYHYDETDHCVVNRKRHSEAVAAGHKVIPAATYYLDTSA